MGGHQAPGVLAQAHSSPRNCTDLAASVTSILGGRSKEANSLADGVLLGNRVPRRGMLSCSERVDLTDQLHPAEPLCMDRVVRLLLRENLTDRHT